MRRQPDFGLLRRALLRQGELERVPFLELKADDEIIAAVLGLSDPAVLSNLDTKAQTEMLVRFWTDLGYDAVRLRCGLDLKKARVSTEDTAELKRGQRDWQSEEGIISSWEDFERYSWPTWRDADFSHIEHAARILPDGMELLISPYGMLEPIMWMMGFQGLSLALYDQPDLVATMVERIASIYTPIAEAVLDMDRVAGLFVGDDMGFKTSTMFSPKHLRTYIFPYHKQLAAMTHARDKIYVLHNCGNLSLITNDLIDDVKIDARHSFEDVILPVEEFKAQYGTRVGVVGGVDMDFLCRASEEQVRARVRAILDACMPGGGYVLGTGNSVANYVPIRNFLAMVDEGHRWRPTH
jgi:uroporphyrinogen decarboxylase